MSESLRSKLKDKFKDPVYEDDYEEIYFDFNEVTPELGILRDTIPKKFLDLQRFDDLDDDPERKRETISLLNKENRRRFSAYENADKFKMEIVMVKHDKDKINFKINDELIYKNLVSGKETYCSREEFYNLFMEQVEFRDGLHFRRVERIKKPAEIELEEEAKKELEDFYSKYGPMLKNFRKSTTVAYENYEKEKDKISDSIPLEKEFNVEGGINLLDFHARSALMKIGLQETEKNVKLVHDLCTSIFQGFVERSIKEPSLAQQVKYYSQFALSEKMFQCLKMVFKLKDEKVRSTLEAKPVKEFFKAHACLKEIRRLIPIKDKLLFDSFSLAKELLVYFKESLKFGDSFLYLRMNCSMSFTKLKEILTCLKLSKYKKNKLVVSLESLELRGRRRLGIKYLLYVNVPLRIWVLLLACQFKFECDNS